MLSSVLVQRLLAYGMLLAVGIVLLAPFAWLLSTALKSESADLFVYPPQWLPDPIVWGNFAKAWNILDFPRLAFNTFFIAICTVAINLSSAHLLVTHLPVCDSPAVRLLCMPC